MIDEWGRIGHNEYFCAKCKEPIKDYRKRIRVEVSVYPNKQTSSKNSLKDFHLGCTSIDKDNYQWVGL